MEPGDYRWPRISPDGQKIALVRRDQGNEDIWVVDLESGVSTRLTFDPTSDYGPVWTPDGERVVFYSRRDGPSNLYWRRADGTDQVERLTDRPADQRAYGWAPDGSLLFTQEGDIWSMGVEPRSDPVPLMQEAYVESEPTLSADGNFIAVHSEELGYPEIFVRPFPDLRGKWLVSTLDVATISNITNADLRDGRSPVWSRRGRSRLP